jgi:hypothetical protein
LLLAPWDLREAEMKGALREMLEQQECPDEDEKDRREYKVKNVMKWTDQVHGP